MHTYILVCTYVLMPFTSCLWLVKLVKVLCVSMSIPVLLPIGLPLLFYFEFHWEIWLWSCAFCDEAQAIIACVCAKTCAIPNIEVLVQAKNSSHKSSTGRVIFSSTEMPSCSPKL